MYLLRTLGTKDRDLVNIRFIRLGPLSGGYDRSGWTEVTSTPPVKISCDVERETFLDMESRRDGLLNKVVGPSEESSRVRAETFTFPQLQGLQLGVRYPTSFNNLFMGRRVRDST